MAIIEDLSHFATKADPLVTLTKKGLPEQIQWTPELDQAFKLLKRDLVQSVMLKNPDYTQVFQLQTDASDVGIGAVLSQGGENDQPVAYFSRRMLEREKHYSTVEKKCLAILLGVKAFATYLIGKPFVLQTDNRALIWLQKFKDKNARLTRWSLALQPYTFEVQHRKGRDNANADALSRLPVNEKDSSHSTNLCFTLMKGGRNVADPSCDELTDHLNHESIIISQSDRSFDESISQSDQSFDESIKSELLTTRENQTKPV